MQMLFVIVAVVVCSASALTNTTDDSKRAAVSKVTQMLEDLQEKVLSEGNKETLSYDKFACFCKDGIAQRPRQLMMELPARALSKPTLKASRQPETAWIVTLKI